MITSSPPKAKVSIILPFYNAELFLQEACQSIINQTFKDWVLIAINDGSSDSSEEIVRSFGDDRINLISNSSNIGLVASLNKGLALSNGEYVARMDADDISLPNRLTDQVNFLDYHSDLIGCGSQIQLIDAFGSDIDSPKYPTRPSDLKAAFMYSNPIAHPTILIRTAIIRQVGGYKMQMHYENCSVEDYDLWTRLASLGYKLANLPEVHLKYRIVSTSLTSVAKKNKKLFTASRQVLLNNLQDRSQHYSAPFISISTNNYSYQVSRLLIREWVKPSLRSRPLILNFIVLVKISRYLTGSIKRSKFFMCLLMLLLDCFLFIRSEGMTNESK